jgi:hypothetical protein
LWTITFIYDVERYLSTLSMLETLEADLFVPAHTEPVKDMKALAGANRSAVMQIRDDIIKLCAPAAPFETILRELFSMYHLTMNFEQYVLVGSTVKSYLSWLRDLGVLDVGFENNTMLWRRK